MLEEPPNTRFVAGTRLVSEEAADRVSRSALVSASPMMKETGTFETFSSADWSGMLEINGGVFSVTTQEALLLVAFGSGVAEEARTKFVIVPEPEVTTVMEAEAFDPLGSEGTDQATVWLV